MERRDVTRSKTMISRAYLELALKKPLERITVKEVIDQANVSRGTFYAHYLDIYDLQDKVMENFIIETMTIQDPNIANLPVNIPKGVAFVINTFKQQQEMICALSNHGKNTIFASKCKQILCEELERNFQLTTDTSKRRLVQMCIASILVDLAMEAVLHPNTFKVDDATDVAVQFICGGLENKQITF